MQIGRFKFFFCCRSFPFSHRYIVCSPASFVRRVNCISHVPLHLLLLLLWWLVWVVCGCCYFKYRLSIHPSTYTRSRKIPQIVRNIQLKSLSVCGVSRKKTSTTRNREIQDERTYCSTGRTAGWEWKSISQGQCFLDEKFCQPHVRVFHRSADCDWPLFL